MTLKYPEHLSPTWPLVASGSVFLILAAVAALPASAITAADCKVIAADLKSEGAALAARMKLLKLRQEKAQALGDDYAEAVKMSSFVVGGAEAARKLKADFEAERTNVAELNREVQERQSRYNRDAAAFNRGCATNR